MSGSVITCLTWVKRGVAKPQPNSVLKRNGLKRERASSDGLPSDLEEEVKQWSSDSDDTESEDEETEGNVDAEEGEDSSDENEEDVEKLKRPLEDDDLEGIEEFNLDDYDSDDDNDNQGMKMELSSLSVFTRNEEDPFLTKKPNQEELEEDDLSLKSDDNLIVVGRTEEDGAIMEVYVCNESEDSLFVHHEVMLPSFPLALEWMDFNPGENERGNLVAVGYFTPAIDVWDLDVVDALEPVFSLGATKKSKKKTKSHRVKAHTDSVMDLSWNHNVRNVMCSASADHTIVLWDMETGKVMSQMTHHSDKVQSVEWHPFESQSLLSGGCDGLICTIDCSQNPNKICRKWQVEGEVEKVMWNHFDPHQFLVSTDTGIVQGFDVRKEKCHFMLKAHEDAVTCMSMSHYLEGCITTASADQTCKLWSIQNNKPSLLDTKKPKMGIIHCASFSPDSECTLAAGGAKDSLRTLDFRKAAEKSFTKREHFAIKTSGKKSKKGKS